MSLILDGTNGETFPDGSVQSTSAIVGGKVPYSVLPTGSVLQVVNVTYSTQVSSSSTTMVDTGLTASITPRFSTSKILVMIDQSSVSKDTSNTGVNIKLQRNGSDLGGLFGYVAAYTNSTASSDIGSVTISYLDSPATTSSVVYKTQFSSNSPTASAIVQQFNAMSTITLMEIAG